MSIAINIPNLREGYREIVDLVLATGSWVSPRGARTLEVTDVAITVENPYDLFPWGVGRRVRPELAAADALQLCGGYQDPAQFFAINPGMRRFTDYGVFWGAYGPRIRGQFQGLQRQLEMDRFTRRAVLTFWDPMYDVTVPDVRNYPCMTEVQFLVRDGRLETFGRMRANDLWLGLTYDMFTLQQLGFTVANCFGLDVGPYHHHVVSLHLYEEHLQKAEEVRYMSDREPFNNAQGFGRPGQTIEQAAARARSIGAGVLPDDATESEEWYHKMLAGFYGER